MMTPCALSLKIVIQQEIEFQLIVISYCMNLIQFRIPNNGKTFHLPQTKIEQNCKCLNFFEDSNVE